MEQNRFLCERIKGEIKQMSLKMKLNIVNKHEYEENEDYREVIVRIPKENEKLERDFRYLGLDYNNLSIQDAHVLECEVIDTSNPQFSAIMSTEISNIIAKANEDGYTTPFQDIKSMFNIIKLLDDEGRNKLLAVLEMKREQICNMKDAVKYGNNLDCFEYYNNISTHEEYAQELIDKKEVTLEDVADYINMEELGEAYVNGNDGIFTDQGLIFETSTIEINIKNLAYKKEEDEEFE